MGFWKVASILRCFRAAAVVVSARHGNRPGAVDEQPGGWRAETSSDAAFVRALL